MKKINPFKPHSPVPVAMFAGRMNEINILEKGLFQTKNGHSNSYLVTGERGIGKSSLMMLLKHLANGVITSPDYDPFRFVTINLIVSDRMEITSFIKLIEKNISRELGKLEQMRSFLKSTWDFVQRIKVMDSGISQSEKDSEVDVIIDEFAYSLAETCNRITSPLKHESPKDGIVFLIDEADNAAEDLRIGYFFKVVSELLQQHSCGNVMFVVAGLPELVEKLAKSHESSVRIFHQLNIKELSPKDRKYVVTRGLEKGNELNGEATTITDNALLHISTLSEGYPHFIQQFSYSAFEYNNDGEISETDVLDSAFAPGGAIDAIGGRYYVNAYYDKIKSDEYREVLTIMAENMNSWIKKSDIRAKFTGSDKILSNALQALTTRKIILKNPSIMGEYRLQQRGFALWIRLFGSRKK